MWLLAESLCDEKIGPGKHRLGNKRPPPGYCLTIEHNKEYRPSNIDIEYYEEQKLKRNQVAKLQVGCV